MACTSIVDFEYCSEPVVNGEKYCKFHLDYFTDLSASIEKFSDKLNKQPNLDDNIVIDNESLKDYREYESAYFLEFKIMAVNFNPSTWDGSYLSRLNDH